MFNVVISFFTDLIFFVLDFLLRLIDYSSLEVTAAKAGENPVIAYVMLMFMAVTFVLMITAAFVKAVYKLIMHLYRKEIQWRKFKASKALHPVMPVGLAKVN